MDVRKIIITGLLALFAAAMLIETANPATANAQENQGTTKYPRLVEAVNSGKLSTALFESAVQFEERYPRLVKAFRREKIDYKLFRTVFRGVGKKDQGIMKLVQAFQDGTTGISEFRRQIIVFRDDLHASLETCNAPWCHDRADVFYTGCWMGGGDAFECFVITEQYMCVCMNATCGYNNICS